MKKWMVISLLLVLTMVSMRNVVVLVAFKINQSTIIAQWCVNKDKPELQCNGQCHLKKQIKQQAVHSSKKNAPLPIVVIEQFQQPIYFSAPLWMLPNPTIVANACYTSFVPSLIPQCMGHSVFHPPPLLS